MTTPTAARGRLLRAMHGEGLFEDELLAETLADARAALLAELEAGVEGLPERHAWGDCITRAAVLDLIRKEREK